ncbi:chemotaxis protein CheW [Sutcliffiella cohnii]
MDATQYIEVFLDESREHLQAVSDNLLKLEKQPQELPLVDEIFRSAHTLKGMAATMEYIDVASLTHQMENVLDLVRKEELLVTTEMIDLTFEALESLEEMVSDISEGGDGKKDVSLLVSKLEQMENGTTFSTENVLPLEQNPSYNEIKLDQYQFAVVSQGQEQGLQAFQVTVFLNEDCVLKAVRAFMVFEVLEQLGEVIQSVPSIQDLESENFDQQFSVMLLTKSPQEEIETKIIDISEIQAVGFKTFTTESQGETEQAKCEKIDVPSSKEKIKKGSSKTIRVNIERIDQLMNQFEEMVIDRGRLEDLSKRVGDDELIEAVERLSRVSQEMQGMMLSLRMMPIEQVFNRFPKMVRGLAKDLKKEIVLEISGAETELDRTVIDEIGDPLVHLLRNSLDHGIESPHKRKQEGKPAEGTITLRAYHSSNHVFIEIEDDGGGINRQKIVDKAIENGVLSSERSQNLPETEVYNLIFASGFSTADEVSDISGRGVGLDVVRNKIESLGGHIFVDSESGKGSKFSIQLPLTLSVLSTLLVYVQDETYAVPLSSIEETVLLRKERVLQVNGQPAMDFRNKVIPLVFLKKVFDVRGSKDENEEHVAVVIVRKGDKLTGLVVDSFLGQKEVVLKSLGEYLGCVNAVSGATILGDGHVSLIIDPNALIT